MNLLQQLALGFLLSAIIMTVTWVVCIRLNNGGWVDVVWAYTIGALATLYQLLGPQPWQANLGWLLTLAWSLRLGTHLAKRIAREPEDGRYQDLKKKWGGLKSPKMAGFFGIQATAAFLFAIPALIAIRYGSEGWSAFHTFAALIAAVAIIGESIADSQLKTFKQKTTDPLAVCKVGLWRYSRHPNYFFEWIHWLAYPLLVVHSISFWPMLLAPITMLFLVTKMTGIPPTEAQALRKRGDRYRQYQNETSAFFPWFPKTAKTTLAK